MLNRNQKNRMKVENYIKENGHGRLLYFGKEVKKPPYFRRINDRIYWILTTCFYNDTYFVDTKKYQCYKGANRSAYDLWMIYKYYFKDIPLYKFMEHLYSLCDSGKVSTCFCMTIQKRVFYIFFHSTIVGIVFSPSQYIFDELRFDEFDLLFHNWE